MKLKKNSIIWSIILFSLILIITVILYNYIGPGAKDVTASKDFISKLYSINAISTEENLGSIKYKRSRVLDNQNELVSKSIVTQNFGIDLDKNNNVIGFTKKEISSNVTKINLQEARILAEKYLKSIYDSEVVLKAVDSNEGTKKLPYYSFIYTKQENGYAFYFDEIKLNIDKENGFLDGYSNSTMQRETKEPVINITEENAEEIAKAAFEKYNKEGQVKSDSDLVYVDNKMEKNDKQQYEVSYVINVAGKNDNNANILWKIFVSTETGKILNILKDGAEKEVITN